MERLITRLGGDGVRNLTNLEMEAISLFHFAVPFLLSNTSLTLKRKKNIDERSIECSAWRCLVLIKERI